MKKLKITYKDYIKANRKGSREAELMNSTGWKSSHKIHKDKTMYSRKQKHKKTISDDGFSFINYIFLHHFLIPIF